jgi:hypothetical protein
MARKAQASTEFIIVFSIIAIIMITVGFLIQRQYAETTNFKTHAAGDRIAKRFAENINQIVVVGEGMSLCFTAPGEVIDIREYVIKFFTNEPTVFIEAGEDTWSAPLLTAHGKCVHPICTTGSSGTENDVWVTNLGPRGICVYDCNQGCNQHCTPTACP